LTVFRAGRALDKVSQIGSMEAMVGGDGKLLAEQRYGPA